MYYIIVTMRLEHYHHYNKPVCIFHSNSSSSGAHVKFLTFLFHPTTFSKYSIFVGKFGAFSESKTYMLMQKKCQNGRHEYQILGGQLITFAFIVEAEESLMAYRRVSACPTSRWSHRGQLYTTMGIQVLLACGMK